MRRAWILAAPVLALIVATSSVAAATTRAVSVGDNFFSPFTRTTLRGDYVRWTNAGGVGHTTTSIGALRWDRMIGPGLSYLYTNGGRGFFAAGIFPYFCRVHPGMTGRVSVPLSASPTSAARGTRFTIRWATITAPAGYRYQVQKRNPSSTVFALWRTTAAAVASFATTSTTPRGTYYFRARLQRWTGTAWVSSGYSAARSVSVL
jgi:plastocyanin